MADEPDLWPKHIPPRPWCGGLRRHRSHTGSGSVGCRTPRGVAPEQGCPRSGHGEGAYQARELFYTVNTNLQDCGSLGGVRLVAACRDQAALLIFRLTRMSALFAGFTSVSRLNWLMRLRAQSRLSDLQSSGCLGPSHFPTLDTLLEGNQQIRSHRHVGCDGWIILDCIPDIGTGLAFHLGLHRLPWRNRRYRSVAKSKSLFGVPGSSSERNAGRRRRRRA